MRVGLALITISTLTVLFGVAPVVALDPATIMREISLWPTSCLASSRLHNTIKQADET